MRPRWRDVTAYPCRDPEDGSAGRPTMWEIVVNGLLYQLMRLPQHNGIWHGVGGFITTPIALTTNMFESRRKLLEEAHRRSKRNTNALRAALRLPNDDNPRNWRDDPLVGDEKTIRVAELERRKKRRAYAREKAAKERRESEFAAVKERNARPAHILRKVEK